MLIRIYLKLKKIFPFVATLLKGIHRFLVTTKHKVFKTNMRFLNHLRPYLRIFSVRLFYKSELKDECKPVVDEINDKGFITLKKLYSSSSIEIVREKLKKLLDTSIETRIYGNTRSLLQSFDFKGLFPELIELLHHKKVIDIIEGFYGCPYQLHYVSCYHRLSFTEEESQHYDLQSANWHFDDNTTDTLHLVIYLHDTKMEHGPTVVMSKKRTRELLRRGFYSRNDYRIPVAEMEDPKHAIHLTCDIGDAHFMLAPLCLHRAGHQQEGYERFSVIFSFRPGLEPSLIKRFKGKSKILLYRLLEFLSEDFDHAGIKSLKRRDYTYTK